MTTSASKSEVRKQIKQRLKQISSDNINKQSETAQSNILSLPQYQRAQRLSIYLSMPVAEAQTSLLVHHALQQGKTVFVPYIHHPATSKRKIIDMLRLASVEDYETLAHDSWGIPSLLAESVGERENAMGGQGPTDGELLEVTEDGEGRKGVGTLDLVVMPGVAFDEGMNRLGHGGGFYDGWLSRYCSDGTRKPFLGAFHYFMISLFELTSDILQSGYALQSKCCLLVKKSQLHTMTGLWMR